MTLKHYIVTLKRFEDLDDFYDDMETPGGNLYIPDRAVDLVHRRPISRNTHYMLTDEEAQSISNDPRVLAVELSPAETGIKPEPMWERSTRFWDKGTVSTDNQHRNWGIYWSTLTPPYPSRWSQFDQPSFSTPQSVNITASGKNVDVVIVDGDFYSMHPEYAVNEDGTGGSRLVKFNWFQYASALGVSVFPSSYTYDHSLINDPNNSSRRSENNHGAHVAGTACGNTQGWAVDANIYNINPYGNSYNTYDISFLFDFIRLFHINKPVNPLTGRPNPTVVNNSWGFFDRITTSITTFFYRGQQYNRPTSGWTTDLLREVKFDRGYNTAAIRVPSIDADIEDCIAAGIIMVGAAGNINGLAFNSGTLDGDSYYRKNDGSTNFYLRGPTPGASGTSLCVGAIAAEAEVYKSGFSTGGPRVNIWSAGVNIMSSINFPSGSNTYDARNDQYFIQKLSGTSMASPQVAGLVACLLEIYPNWNQASVTQYLQANGMSLPVYEETSTIESFSFNNPEAKSAYYRRERPIQGQCIPKAVQGVRNLVGQVYPRPRIYSYGKTIG